MKSIFKKALAFALVATMVLTFAACGGAKNYAADNTEFVIGVSGPLTGPAAVYGVAVKNSAQMAVDEINAAGGLNGVKFKLVVTDDQHDATKVAANYASMLEGGMQVSLGTVTTAPGLEYTNLSVEDNVFFLTPSASGDDIPKNDNGFQMCFADGNQGAVAADYVNGLGLKEIGIFYKSDDAYSNGIYEQFKDKLDDSIKTVEAVFTDANDKDFSAQITTLKNCKFIFMPIYYTPASIFMTQAKDTVAADAVYYGCDGFDGLAGQFEDFSIIPQEVSMLSHFDSNATEGAPAEYIKKYTEKFGADTLNQFGASAYDCVYAIFNAMKAAIDAGEKIDVTISPSDLCEILKAQFTGDFSYDGVTGTDAITWEDNGYVKKSAVKYTLKTANSAQ
ncbi:MAG: ABC transporter substrate-binding protein [Oscillospiraceae bacterium]|nr:ABC transporter substrate-binding protein [Oscillospiraceae bacterium]